MVCETDKRLFLIEKIIELRREENTRFWTVFGILSIANGVLINAVVSKEADPLLVKGVSIVGVVLSVFWIGIQVRFSHYCRHWEDKIRGLEKDEEDRFKLLTESSPPWFSVSTKRGGYVNLIFLVAWLALLVRAFS